MTGEAIKTKLFTPALNRLAYAKVAFYGSQGAGKTGTAMRVAIGLSKLAGGEDGPRPIFFVDTETGSDFFVDKQAENAVRTDLTDGAEIPLYQLKTRAFRQLQKAIEEAEANGAILVIDSVSHFWDELIAAYMKRMHRKIMKFQDWQPVKHDWREMFATPFVNSKCHIVSCGRLQQLFEDMFDEEGNRDIVQVGSRMRAEKEFGYEASLEVEMESMRVGVDELRAAKDKKERAGLSIRSDMMIQATVLKDRSEMLNGQVFQFPTFEDFLPHVQWLNLGGEHLGVDATTSEALFSTGNSHAQRKRKKEIALDELKEEFSRAFPGRDKETNILKSDVANEIFGTRSWEAVQDMKLEEIVDGLTVFRRAIEEIQTTEQPDVADIVSRAKDEVKAEREMASTVVE